MGRRRNFLAALAALALMAPATGRAQGPVTALSEYLISITPSFVGKDLLLFGAVEGGGGDIIIVIRGPDADLVVRRKARVAGIWVNRDATTYRKVPGYYAVLSSRPLRQIASSTALERLGIGIGNLKFDAVSASKHAVAARVAFQQAMVRLKQNQEIGRASCRERV